MKTYRVACWRTNYGFYDVVAKNQKSAEVKANENLWNGIVMDGSRDYDCGVADCEALTNFLEKAAMPQ